MSDSKNQVVISSSYCTSCSKPISRKSDKETEVTSDLMLSSFSTGASVFTCESSCLSIFINKCNRGTPLKDNFELFIMRQIRKLIRFLDVNKVPSQGFIALKILDTAQAKILLDLSIILNDDPNLVKNILDSKEEKKTDKSRFFSNSLIQKIFFKLVELTEMISDSRALCERLRLRCCLNDVHTNECDHKWDILKSYLKCNFLSEFVVNSENSEQTNLKPSNPILDVIEPIDDTSFRKEYNDQEILDMNLFDKIMEDYDN